MNIKKELINAGQKVETHASDIYTLKNEITEKIISMYEFKNNVTCFISQIDNKTWYEIPFANYRGVDFND